MKSFERFKKDLSEMDRSIAGPGLIGSGIRGIVNLTSGPLKNASRVANIFLSKRTEKQKMLDAVRKSQERINTEVANKETLDSTEVKKQIKKSKESGKYVVRDPENKFSNK